MIFLFLGLALTMTKYLEFGPVANLSWLIVLSPFALTVVWWTYADMSGHTMRKEAEKMDKRRDDHIQKRRMAITVQPAKRTKK